MGMVLLAADRLQGERLFSNLILGQGLSVVASVLFILSPSGSIWGPVLVAVGNAASVALFRSSNNSYWANLVGDRQRASVFSASAALTALVMLPAGPLAGMAYSVWSRGPFVLGIVLQCVLPAGPLAGMAYSVWSRGPFVLGIVLQCVALALTVGLALGAEDALVPPT